MQKLARAVLRGREMHEALPLPDQGLLPGSFRMRFFVAVFCLTALTTHPWAAKAAEPLAEVDFSTVKRSIAREPKYVAQPRYALFVLDPAGQFRVWAVFDKSQAELSYY